MCNCYKIAYFFGNMIYICERLVSCCAATSVVTCIVATLLIMLALGIGLGYNYCYVDMDTGRYKSDEPWEKETTPLPVQINSTMVVRLFGGVDFSVLIKKIKERRQNCTLNLIV